MAGLAGAAGGGASGDAHGAGAEAASGARGARRPGGRCRAGGAGAGRRLWRPGLGGAAGRKGRLREQGSRRGTAPAHAASSKALPGHQRGQTQGVTWEEGRDRSAKTGQRPARAHRRRGPGAAGVGAHRTGACPDLAAAAAWSPGARTCPAAGAAGVPWAAIGKRPHLSCGWGRGGEEGGLGLRGHASSSQPQGPRPTSHRCSIHSARSSRRRSPLRRNRSPRPPARCPGAPSRRLRFHLQAQTGGRRLSAPPWGWPGSLPPPPGLAWAPGLTAHPWDGQGPSPGTRPAQGLPSALAPWSPHCFAGSRPHCRTMT